MESPQPDCATCLKHYITYESRHPHGCQAFEFKSSRMPYLDVKESSGEDCRAYEARVQKKPGTRRTKL